MSPGATRSTCAERSLQQILGTRRCLQPVDGEVPLLLHEGRTASTAKVGYGLGQRAGSRIVLGTQDEDLLSTLCPPMFSRCMDDGAQFPVFAFCAARRFLSMVLAPQHVVVACKYPRNWWFDLTVSIEGEA